MKNIMRILVVMVVFCSCSSRNVFREKRTSVGPEVNFSLDTTSSNSDFLLLFGLYENPKDVFVKFDASGDLRIEYKSNYLGRNGFRAFKGNFKKNYYEVYLSKKKVFFPPVYCKTDIRRIRLTVLNDSILLVDKYVNSSAMVALFAAGNSSRQQYSYKIIKQK